MSVINQWADFEFFCENVYSNNYQESEIEYLEFACQLRLIEDLQIQYRQWVNSLNPYMWIDDSDYDDENPIEERFYTEFSMYQSQAYQCLHNERESYLQDRDRQRQQWEDEEMDDAVDPFDQNVDPVCME